MKKVRRSAGALAPLFSLPGVRDVGSLGRCARQFVDDLAESGQRFWQMLPINPIDDFGSPYAGRSAFAGETLYLDLEDLRDENLLDDADLEDAWTLPDSQKLDVSNSIKDKSNKRQKSRLDDSNTLGVPFFCDLRSERVDYRAALRRRRPCWEKAFQRFRRGDGGAKFRVAENAFRRNSTFWLDNYVLFQTASEEFETPDWSRWPVEIRRRDPEALERFSRKFAEKLDFLRFLQLVFDVQWNELRAYCKPRSVRLFGDVPIYVGQTSADVWAFPELFQVDADGRTLREAGVPADDFNPDGQRWNSPLYRWERHRETNFQWWRLRMLKTIARFDVVRLDHFIGFYNFYSFPGRDVDNALDLDLKNQNTKKVEKKSTQNAQTAQIKASDELELSAEYEDGWEPGPQEAFFDAIFADCPRDAFVAEDLGVVNAGVCRLRDRYSLPGMRVLEFSFDNVRVDKKTGVAPNPIDSWTENSVAYTGTHDAAPILGWLADVAKFGGDAWETLDFDGIANVLKRYQRPDDAPAKILGNENSLENANISTGISIGISKKKSTKSVEKPTLGVATQVVPLAPNVAALRTATLRAVASSACRLAIFPIQDVLGLSNDARVNFPGVGVGNWSWRLANGALTSEIKREWRRLTEETDRLDI